MNISDFALAVVILGLVLFGVSDFFEEEPDTSMVLPQGTCDPAKTQVIHTDGARQMTQVLDRGVNCVVVVR